MREDGHARWRGERDPTPLLRWRGGGKSRSQPPQERGGAAGRNRSDGMERRSSHPLQRRADHTSVGAVGRGQGGAMPHCCGSKRPLPACRPWVSRYAEARSGAAAVIAAGWLGGAMLTSASERLSRAQQHASAAAPGTARSASLFPSSCQGASVPMTLNGYPGLSSTLFI